MRLTAVALVAVFVYFVCANTLFVHSHRYGNLAFAHSHPYSKSDPHDHTAASLMFIAEMNAAARTVAAADPMSVPQPRRAVVVRPVCVPTPRIAHGVRSVSCLRGPPAMAA